MELFFLLLLVGIMAAALGSGYPVAFALPGAAIITIGLAAGTGYLFEGNTDAFFHSGGPQQWLTAGVTNLRGVYWEVERDTLIAIPLFIFMGIMLQRSKIAEDLLVTMAQLFGPVPGGLGISVVFVGALLAATTGIVGATVVAMGMISLPAMLRSNYSTPLATGTIAASGTLGQIIPPSIVLIILADQLASAADQASTLRKNLYTEATGDLQMPSIFDVSGTSAGEMFLGALIPGLVLVGIYMTYILIYAIIRPKAAPAVHDKSTKWNLAFWGKVFLALVPPLALIFLVLGSIIGGIATVNQAGAIGAAGALIMASYRLAPEGTRMVFGPALIAILGLVLIAIALSGFQMNVKAISSPQDQLGIAIGAVATVLIVIALIWSSYRAIKNNHTLQGVMLETAKTTSLVFIILLGAAMLTAAFRGFGGEELVREFLNSLPGGFWTQFVIVMAVIFVLGFFLDFIEIAVVVVPIVAPILLSDPGANVTAVWLGVMIGLNIQTSFLTPPFGFALFYLRGVAPAVVKTLQIYRGVIPFIVLQLIALGIVGAYPPLVNYLPNRVSLLSETAPPPRNPKLQLCLEDYVGQQLASNPGTSEAIEAARALDLTPLPEDLAEEFADGVDAAEDAIARMQEIQQAEEAVTAAAIEYRPQQTVVRDLEKKLRRLREELDTESTLLGRMEADSAERPEAETHVAELEEEIAELETQVPEGWDEVHDTFAELTQAEDSARNQYRRAADNAYSGPAEVLAILESNAAFAELEDELNGLRDLMENGQGEADAAQVEAVEELFDEVEGAGDVESAIASARREIDEDDPDRESILEDYEEALAEYAAQAQWRADSEALIPGIRAYVEAVEGTFGIRSQDRFTRQQALAMASCNARHRDVSLNF
ncbi:TRAP transporter large permease subunit [Maritimibacter sp. UBA3975]|uniref:TRAP transporter large permease n=1 Tax=Maritimibacter sp. UBA3975 TaxID=1946833 RepID=UPI000C0A31E0|nr:TRAP transporter large permease subunit [Maritimibacter sp. UBA3975]MAM63396.1 C4-dicarboxylate ABC transporter permease [Maritimibacter sp.]|tara:strand:- start:83408 stop:86059 length:2652 start_codon:yes stop_codon:yes gene_type:complete